MAQKNGRRSVEWGDTCDHCGVEITGRAIRRNGHYYCSMRCADAGQGKREIKLNNGVILRTEPETHKKSAGCK